MQPQVRAPAPALQSASYTIAAGATQAESFTLPVNDCTAHTAGASVTSVVKV